MTRQLHLIALTFLLVSMNACIMANYQITAQDSSEKRAIGNFKDKEVVQVVVPRYYNVTLVCGSMECLGVYRWGERRSGSVGAALFSIHDSRSFALYDQQQPFKL